MRLYKILVGGGIAGAGLSTALSGVLALLATKPNLAAKIFGSDNPARHPSEVGLTATDVEYTPGCPAWWIPAADAVASVVIVHGFETSPAPHATDPGPRLEIAALLADAGFSSLIISLGYGSRIRPHSGGDLEADDIAAAVHWVASETHAPVAIVGCSAGGHASVVAAARCDAFAVVTDSSFVNFVTVVQDQGSENLGAPAWLFKPTSLLMRLLTGRPPIDLASIDVAKGVPMLHIHGDADGAISHDNLAELAALTGGATLTVPGADHIDSLRVAPDTYRNVVVGFLQSSLAKFEAQPRLQG